MKKGLRRASSAVFDVLMALNYCPDEEGIKTHQSLSTSYIAAIFELLP